MNANYPKEPLKINLNLVGTSPMMNYIKIFSIPVRRKSWSLANRFRPSEYIFDFERVANKEFSIMLGLVKTSKREVPVKFWQTHRKTIENSNSLSNSKIFYKFNTL